MRKLVLQTRESGAGRQFLVEPHRQVVFGRCAPSEICLGDGFMSSRHFEIEHDGKRAEVQDLKSSNGTFVNEARVNRAEIFEGDVIKSGQTIFEVSWEVAFNHPTDTIPPNTRTPNIAPPPQIRGPLESEEKPSGPISAVPPLEKRKGGWKRADVSPFDFEDDLLADTDAVDVDERIHRLDQESTQESRSGAESMMRMHRIVLTDGFSSAHDLTEELSRSFSVIVVADFWKIGESMPKSLESYRVWDDPGLTGPWSPLAVPGSQWLAEVSRDWTERLCRSDGWLLILLESNVQSKFAEDSMQDGWRRLSFRQLEGFSEQGGLNAWFWPSMFHLMVESTSDRESAWLFEEHRVAWIYRRHALRSRFEAIARPEFAPYLESHRFHR
jgi:pSer/pThr/pTyr-binding forkhead associated (FHA) protein